MDASSTTGRRLACSRRLSQAGRRSGRLRHAAPVPAFAIAPTGPFDLAAAAGFGFGPTENTPRRPEEPRMRLAFCVDGLTATAGVALRQAPDGTVHGSMSGDADVEVVRRQVARILSLTTTARGGRPW